MGLFSSNKKVCPLCGNPTPRLLALKVEDTPLCKECERKIDLPQGAIHLHYPGQKLLHRASDWSR